MPPLKTKVVPATDADPLSFLHGVLSGDYNGPMKNPGDFLKGLALEDHNVPFSESSNVGISPVDQAIKDYPILSKIGLRGVESYGSNAPGGLEFWPENEPGTLDYARPKDIPLGSIGVQIFSDKVAPKDVLADVTSHHFVKNDPVVSDLYNQFLGSLTEAQWKRIQGDYEYAKQNEGEQRSFGSWLGTTRLPAYFRGYTFQQWPKDFTSRVFTPEQIDIFDKVRDYVGYKPHEE